MNLHTPERGADETQAAYKLRRSLSRAAVRTMTLRGIGDQRKAPSSRQQLRDSQRANGNGPRASFGPTLMTAYANLRSEALPTACPRDDFGAYTLTGARDQVVVESPFPARVERRKWLAGISAQRGY